VTRTRKAPSPGPPSATQSVALSAYDDADPPKALRTRSSVVSRLNMWRSQDETKQAVLRLSVDGLIPAAIADKIGVSDKYVAAILRAA
jgi:hypothetical protein